MTTKKKKYKLDIFKLLGKISKDDKKYFDELSTEEQKAFVPRVVCQWLSGTSDKAQILGLDYVNWYVDSLYKHPKLIYLLFCIAVNELADEKTNNRKRNSRYKWIKLLSREKGKQEIVKLIQKEYGYSERDAIEVKDIFSDEDILELAKYHGYQKNEIAKIKKELR